MQSSSLDPPTPFTGILPLSLTEQAKTAVEEVLRASYRPSTPAFSGLIDDFVQDPDNLVRGPYLSLDLPYTNADIREEPFPAVPLGHTPYAHQVEAFRRLQSDAPRSTIIATGTGSGKTECFQLPFLDWCRQHADRPGIKAIVIYPMNALAEDQARRIAARIWNSPDLRGRVTAGMYADAEPQDASPFMKQDDIIRSRQAMHETPPDILLTNYRMLDSLLVRPERKGLWAHNRPGTLRFLVVDELHTFDGAQGTDLACLIRRLKDRLAVPKGFLCCIGTSATLGDRNDTKPVIDYARELFDEEFDPDAVVTEDRQDAAAYLASLGGDELSDRLPAQEAVADISNHEGMQDPVLLIRSLYQAWFGSKAPEDIGGHWRAELGRQLGSHEFLASLLGVLDGGTHPVDEVVGHLRRSFPGLGSWTQSEVRNLLQGFMALLAFARQSDEATNELRPFLSIQVHFWIRELKRMVVSLPPDSHDNNLGPASDTHPDGPPTVDQPEVRDRDAVTNQPTLLHSDDLPDDYGSAVLPVVHCRECAGMAWVTTTNPENNGFVEDRDAIYREYFAKPLSPRLVYLMAQAPDQTLASGSRVVSGHVCCRCLRWETSSPGSQARTPGACAGCNGEDWRRAWRMAPNKSGREGSGRWREWACAYCGSATGLGIFGMASTSMASFLTSTLFASTINEDPKLLAFADSVQDVAHKAGFIEARSFRTVLRQAVAAWLADQPGTPSLPDLMDEFTPWVKTYFGDEREFVGAMTHVDLKWFRYVNNLFEGNTDGKLPELPERDIEAVGLRLTWEAFAELTFLSRFGRTLENTGRLCLGVDPQRLEQAGQGLAADAGEQFGSLFEDVDRAACTWFLRGIVHRMLHDGAIRIDPEGLDPIGGLARSNGVWFGMVRARNLGHILPEYGPRARKPLLPGLNAQDEFAPLVDAGSSARWYPHWARKCMPAGPNLRGDILSDFHILAFQHLEQTGIAQQVQPDGKSPIWALRAEHVTVERETVALACDNCGRRIQVPANQTQAWTGMFCPNPGCSNGRIRNLQTETPAPLLGSQLTRGQLRRVNARDHSGLLEAETRRRLEQQFMQGDHRWFPNVLSTTSTLELGVDIGDLSSVMLYAVPPSRANYVQRLGRSGRRDGNSLGLTVVNARSHDLYFWQDTSDMIEGSVEVPGLYLEAFAILRRQFNAYTLERFITDTVWNKPFGTLANAPSGTQAQAKTGFPEAWIRFAGDHRDDLLAGFRAMFDLSDEDDLFAKLMAFVEGTAPGEAFATSIRACLEDAQEERRSWSNRARSLSRRIAAERAAKVPPKDLEELIRPLEMDMRTFRRVAAELGRQDLLQLLTDRGVLPNYAFPAEGIRLRSIILYRAAQQADRDWVEKTYEYARPAASGLSEMAPESIFYAEGHRVTVNAVDLRISEPERWRFCPVCPHMGLDGDGRAVACPRCGSRQWGDLGQVHEMVRLRQVHARDTDRGSRIRDDHEDRTSVRYFRNLYPAFDRDSAPAAYLIQSLPQPFGFEFLPDVEFRDINFGREIDERDLAQHRRIGGQHVLANPFRLCKECGHALSRNREEEPPTRFLTGPAREPAWKKEHAPNCRVLRQEDDQDCYLETYLYYGFSSEAVRIRLPFGSEQEVEVESFAAALHLGLRLKFQGRVDHLRSLPLSLQENQFTSHWLFLYDSVPGGTGYLERLAQPEVFESVLRLALQTMLECSCNQHQDDDERRRRDGCYRCLYRYQDNRYASSVSRDAAIRIVRSILNRWHQIRTAPSVEKVDPDRLAESELEDRFESWLDRRVRRAGGRIERSPLPDGGSGYRVALGNRLWELQRQVLLGSGDSVGEPSRADFILRPVGSTDPEVLPVVLFMDGWRYHRTRVIRDVHQRLSIRASGRFRVWSLTWDDIVQDNDANGRRSAWNPFRDLKVPANPPSDETKALDDLVRNGLAADLLFHYLCNPAPALWRNLACRLTLNTLVFHISSWEHWQELQGGLNDLCEDFAYSLSWRSKLGMAQQGGSFVVAGAEDRDLKAMPRPVDLHPLLYLDTEGDLSQAEWAGALGAFNLLQFLPLMHWVCASDPNPMPFPTAPVADDLPEDGWGEASEFVAEAARALLDALRSPSLPPPEVGWEILSAGEVVVELELAWPDGKVGIHDASLTQAETRPLRSEGWKLFSLETAETRIAELRNLLTER